MNPSKQLRIPGNRLIILSDGARRGKTNDWHLASGPAKPLYGLNLSPRDNAEKLDDRGGKSSTIPADE